MATKALIISDLIPNVHEFEALAVSDGEDVMLTLKDKNRFVSHSVTEIVLSKKDVEDLLELIDSQYKILNE
jgi:hypothetical protein